MFKDRLAAKFGDGKGGQPGAAAVPKPAEKPTEEEEKKEEEDKFKAFKGTAYRLA